MKNELLQSIHLAAKKVWGIVSRNWQWKLLSIVLAIMMWSYIISVDTSITRTKTINNIEVTITGQSALQSRGLAVLMDADQDMPDVRAKVLVPQTSYARVTQDTVNVELDLSRVRQTGRQEVDLIGTSIYGEVVQITPATLEVNIESWDSRSVPVNVELSGADYTHYYYVVSQKNPSQQTVSGASSVVQQVSQAQAVVNAEGMTSSRTISVPYSLLDSEGTPITQMLNRSSSSITVSLLVYPIAQLPVDHSIETATTGALPSGYRISRVEVQPETITVAGDESLLSELDQLTFEPVDVGGRSQSFSTVATINALDDMKYLSSKQVTVTVYIEEIEQISRFENIHLTAIGLGDGLHASLSEDKVKVKATGAYSIIEQLEGKHLQASVDLTGLKPGEYDVPVQVSADNYHVISFETDPQMVHVIISRAE